MRNRQMKPFYDMADEKQRNREEIRRLNSRNTEIDYQAIQFALENGLEDLVKFDWRKLESRRKFDVRNE